MRWHSCYVAIEDKVELRECWIACGVKALDYIRRSGGPPADRLTSVTTRTPVPDPSYPERPLCHTITYPHVLNRQLKVCAAYGLDGSIVRRPTHRHLENHGSLEDTSQTHDRAKIRRLFFRPKLPEWNYLNQRTKMSQSRNKCHAQCLCHLRAHYSRLFRHQPSCGEHSGYGKRQGYADEKCAKHTFELVMMAEKKVSDMSCSQQRHYQHLDNIQEYCKYLPVF